MKKYILLIDSGNDKLEIFEKVMTQKKILNSYDCIVVRNNEMTVKVLNRIRPDIIFINIGAPGMCFDTWSSKISELEILYNTPVYLLVGATENTIQPGLGVCIKNDLTVDFLIRLLQDNFILEGRINVMCNN